MALHPGYVHSYAPAQILTVYIKGAEVIFYDRTVTKVERRGDIFKISKRKYKKYVDGIHMCEQTLVNPKAIVLDCQAGVYKLSMALFVTLDIFKETN